MLERKMGQVEYLKFWTTVMGDRLDCAGGQACAVIQIKFLHVFPKVSHEMVNALVRETRTTTEVKCLELTTTFGERVETFVGDVSAIL